MVQVDIKVTDVNDEKPQFINQPVPFNARLSVQPEPATLVYTLSARDVDTNSSLTMQIIDTQGNCISYSYIYLNCLKENLIYSLIETGFRSPRYSRSI